MRRAAIVYAILLAGCATKQYVYDRPGLTPAKLDHDMTVCRKEANDPQMVALPGTPRSDVAIFNRCMERKGYTVRQAEQH
jgi:hypothetical protein